MLATILPGLPGLVFPVLAIAAQQSPFSIPLVRVPGRTPRLGQALNNIPLKNSQE
jgi:hypothetical protein